MHTRTYARTHTHAHTHTHTHTHTQSPASNTGYTGYNSYHPPSRARCNGLFSDCNCDCMAGGASSAAPLLCIIHACLCDTVDEVSLQRLTSRAATVVVSCLWRHLRGCAGQDTLLPFPSIDSDHPGDAMPSWRGVVCRGYAFRWHPRLLLMLTVYCQAVQ